MEYKLDPFLSTMHVCGWMETKLYDKRGCLELQRARIWDSNLKIYSLFTKSFMCTVALNEH